MEKKYVFTVLVQQSFDFNDETDLYTYEKLDDAIKKINELVSKFTPNKINDTTSSNIEFTDEYEIYSKMTQDNENDYNLYWNCFFKDDFENDDIRISIVKHELHLCKDSEDNDVQGKVDNTINK